jgi:hypothetical protein
VQRDDDQLEVTVFTLQIFQEWDLWRHLDALVSQGP